MIHWITLHKHALAIILALHGATAYDSWTTRELYTNKGYFEANPLVKPFAKGPEVYAWMQIQPLVIDIIRWKYGRRFPKATRAVQIIDISEHAALGIRNQFILTPRQR